jgi:hypothetical protein
MRYKRNTRKDTCPEYYFKCRGNTIFHGIDETNHFQIPHPEKPEIFVAVSSPFKKDVKRIKLIKQRPRVNGYTNPIPLLGQRTYSFILMQENDYKRIHQDDLLGAITASLIGKDRFIQEEAYIFIDGKVGGVQKERAKSLVADVCNIDISRIHLKAGKKFDINYPLVNMADAIAYFLFGNFSLKELFDNPRRKELLF